jgi:hypothetical protein
LPPQPTGDLEPITAPAPIARAAAPALAGSEAAAAPPAVAASVAPQVAASVAPQVAASVAPQVTAPALAAESDDDIPELDDALVRVVEGDVSPKPIHREPTMIVRPRALAQVTVQTSVVPEAAPPDDDAEAWRPRTGLRLAFAIGVVCALGLGAWFVGRDADVTIPPVTAPAPSTAAPSVAEAPRASPEAPEPSPASASPEAPEPSPASASPEAPEPSPAAPSATPSASPAPSASASPRPAVSASPRPSAPPRPSPTAPRRTPQPMKTKPRSTPLFNGSDL